MSNQVKHTAEPWRQDGQYILNQSDEIFVSTDEANARRIVACVNACSGIPTECLEFGPEAVAPASVLQQRDQLLAALERIAKYPADRSDELNIASMREIVRTAIAAAKGGAA